MPILNLERCGAWAVTSGAACVGPVDAVRVVKWTGQVTGCVLHTAVVKALLPHIRLYALSLEGAALAAYYLAKEFELHGSHTALQARAEDLLARYTNHGAGR